MSPVSPTVELEHLHTESRLQDRISRCHLYPPYQCRHASPNTEMGLVNIRSPGATAMVHISSPIPLLSPLILSQGVPSPMDISPLGS